MVQDPLQRQERVKYVHPDGRAANVRLEITVTWMLTTSGALPLSCCGPRGEIPHLGRIQDSRDLNEPPTNIDGGLGVFSAFASDSVFFQVVRE